MPGSARPHRRKRWLADSPPDGVGFEPPVPLSCDHLRISALFSRNKRTWKIHGCNRLSCQSDDGRLRGTEGSNPSPSTRESGEIGGSSRSAALRYLQLHGIVRTQLGGPPTVAGFKVLFLRLQPCAETVRPEGVHRPRGIVHEELPFRDELGQALQIGHPL